ncbi:MAG: hypothetical protein KKH45_01815 [Proteobacteria bacterium]|nr:hypothetical protein [Pseudomonadota bacterium]
MPAIRMIYNNEKGMVLPLGLMFLAIIAILGTTAVIVTTTDLKIGSNYKTSVQAFYVAEAGIERAKLVLFQGSDNGLDDELATKTILDNVSLGNGSYTVQVDDNNDGDGDPSVDSDGKVIVTSTGTAPNNAQSVIEATVELESLFSKAAFGCDEVQMSGGGVTDSFDSSIGSYASQAVNTDSWGNMIALSNGDVGSNGDIKLTGGSAVNGDATPGPGCSVSSSGGGGVTGSTAPNSKVEDCTPLDLTSMMSTASSTNDNGTIPALTDKGKDPFKTPGSLDLHLSGGDNIELSAGTYYFTDVSLGGGSTITTSGKVTIYVEGNYDISGGGVINSGNATNLAVYVSGTQAKLTGGSGTAGAIYAPNADVLISGGGEINGSVFGKTVKNSGGSDFHYDEALGKKGPYLSAKIANWHEVF